MFRNTLFLPQEALDRWLAEGKVDLRGDALTIVDEGRTYRLVESVRVLREVSGTPDGHDLVGRVKSKAFLAELGAEILEGSMVIGDNAYDVVPGFSGTAAGWSGEHAAAPPAASIAGAIAGSAADGKDEALLERFLLGSLRGDGAPKR